MANVTLRFMGYGVSQENLRATVDLSATVAVIGSGTTVDATVDSSAVTQLQARMTALGFVQVAADAQAECSMVQQTVVPSVAGYLRYNIPLGLVFRDGDTTLLEVDTGAGFTPLVYDVDYVHLVRGYTNLVLGQPQNAPPVSVRDAVIGWRMLPAFGPVSAGWTFRFTWTQYVICQPVPPIPKVRVIFDGTRWTQDNTTSWKSNSTTPPNGVWVPPLTGMVAEFWRESRVSGGIRGRVVRGGRRYQPFWRGPSPNAGQDPWLFAVDEFTRGELNRARRKFRVCYYDTATGARSPLSADIVVYSGARPDAYNGVSPVRTERSIWIQ